MSLSAALLVLAVSSAPTPPPRAPLPEGVWGGTHVSLTVTSEGGRLDFDCAHGTLREPIVPDSDGRFDVPGLYVAERPGPARPGDDAGAPARYVGRVSDGDAMTLSVRPTGSDAEIGPYTLTRGRLARVVKCQ